jgi:hypothetical protein
VGAAGWRLGGGLIRHCGNRAGAWPGIAVQAARAGGPGIVVWTGNGEALVIDHIVLGSILTLALFALTYQAYRVIVSLRLVLVGPALICSR